MLRSACQFRQKSQLSQPTFYSCLRMLLSVSDSSHPLPFSSTLCVLWLVLSGFSYKLLNWFGMFWCRHFQYLAVFGTGPLCDLYHWPRQVVSLQPKTYIDFREVKMWKECVSLNWKNMVLGFFFPSLPQSVLFCRAIRMNFLESKLNHISFLAEDLLNDFPCQPP